MGSRAAARHNSVATFAFNHCSLASLGTPRLPFGHVATLQRAYHQTMAGTDAARTVLRRAAQVQRPVSSVAAARHATPVCRNARHKSLSQAGSRGAAGGGVADARRAPRGADFAFTPGRRTTSWRQRDGFNGGAAAAR